MVETMGVPNRGIRSFILMNIYFTPSVDFLTSGGSNTVMSYTCLRPRGYDLTSRLRPGVKRSTEAGNEISLFLTLTPKLRTFQTFQ